MLKAGVAAAAAAWASRSNGLSGQGPRLRYSASSPQGKAMLVKYAQAVGAMKDMTRFPRSDARSWTFQWYTHWIPGPASPWDQAAAQKTTFISDVFMGLPANDPRRLLAESMWDTCQSHAFNPNAPTFFQEIFFCNWHRYFVYYFEEIIRAVLNDQTFTLPYWNYLSGNVADLSIPPEFRDMSSPLFQANRNTWVNAGQRIDQQNPGALNLAALNEPTYIDSPDGSIGFCPVLDDNPHGLVHVMVGTTMNMGRIPFAANDPIFWLHHCNIDRLWETWNRAGRMNPAWPNRQYSFAGGQGTMVSPLAAGANRTASLNYQYDDASSAPPAAPSSLRIVQAVRPARRAVASAPIVLGAQRTRIPLTTAAGAAQHHHQVGEDDPTGGQRYLLLGGVSAPDDAGSTYNVYLDLPDSVRTPGPDSAHYVGTLHFFGAMASGGHTHTGHRVPFNITDKLDVLRGSSSANRTLTFVRHGDEESEPPTISDVALVEA